MAITGTDHVVIAVQDIEQGIQNWRDRLGMKLSHTVDASEAGIQQAFFAFDDGTFVELISPTDAGSPLAGTLASRGEGVQVLALRVDSLDDTVEELQAQGVKLIGVGTAQVFIHPKSANGVMIQLWPKDRKHRWREALGGSDT